MEYIVIAGLVLAAFVAGVVFAQRVKDAVNGVPAEAKAELARLRTKAAAEAASIVANVKAKL